MSRLTLFIFAVACLACDVRAGLPAVSLDGEPVRLTVIRADADHNPFVPDVYPSREDAARAAATRWATAIARPDGDRSRIRLIGDDSAILLVITDAIRRQFEEWNIETMGAVWPAGAVPAGEAWARVCWTEDVVSIQSTDATASARFVDKPWLSNFAAFVGRTPGRWIVAHSDKNRPASALADAARDARAAAAAELTPLVVARFAPSERYDDRDVRRLVERHLLSDRLVVDRFPQKFERPYGSLFREAVLVDASDNRLSELALEMRATLAAERRSRIGGLASAAAVLLVTYALYRFANAFTRGYFTWSLRTAAAVAAAGAVVLVVAVA